MLTTRMESELILSRKRKLCEASSTLKKPFKSPLRKGIDVSSAASTESTSTNISDGRMHTVEYTLTPSSLSSDYAFNSPTTPPQKDTSTSQAPVVSPSNTPRARLASLQKEQHSLQFRRCRQREELDTLNQAINILEKHKLAELEILIRKWRGVSRDAAEDLFVRAKDKVNRMGGVRVYNEKTRKGKMRQQEWGGWDDKQDEDDDEEMGSDVERERERRKAELEEMMSVQEKEGGEAEDEEEDIDADEETFTMDMMLKGLNVDLKIIGFDKDGQRWTD